MNSSPPYGRIGIDQTGIEIYYPIAEDLVLGYYCPSTRNKFNLVYGMSPVIDNLINNLKNRGSISLTEENIGFFNQKQLLNSYRFIYSSQDNFGESKEYLDKYPEFKKVESRITAGPIKQNGMPMGDVLVVFTKSLSFMVSIYDLHSGSAISFKTKEFPIFLTQLNGEEIENVELYSDQVLVRGMREIKINSVDPITTEISIGHANPVMNQLIDSLKNKQNHQKDIG
ncbi:MAG: hypothetical protein IPP15_19290 [Saprospiraceae bacterium]|uniref:Uncharacterized protein n=1 Tax=Candidatus Opimibacter skivensis TaxID=2982028 RepID=A0A9D7SYD7_9BACT|nr:hypothetical protein [Candidatus Opimibacter skivensis]